MDSDISNALSYEIRKELADRYFGFRSLIEQDKDEIKAKVKDYSLTFEQRIGHDLVRLYILLQDRTLIDCFFELTGLNEEIFYDPYTISSATIRKRVFANVIPRGMTRAGRYKRLFLTIYGELAQHVEQYRAKLADLLMEHATIVEEINLFYKKNDLHHIMTFLRTLDSGTHLGNDLRNAATGLVSPGYFEEKMRVLPPGPIDQVLSIVPVVPPLASIKKELKRLAEQAYQLNKNNIPYDEH